MVDNDAPGVWPVWAPGALLAGFIKSSIHCFTQNMKTLDLVVWEKTFVFPIEGVWELMTSIAVPRAG